MANIDHVSFSCFAELSGENDLFNVLDLNPKTGVKVVGQQEIKISSIHGDDSLLVTVSQTGDDTGRSLDIEVTAYDARVPATLIQVQVFAGEKRPVVWSSSKVHWDVLGSSWLSVGDGVGILAIPLRVEAYSKQNLKGNFDGYFLYDVSRAGISQRFNISHVASERYYNCYVNKRLTEGVFVVGNGTLMTTKGHSILSTNLKTGANLWKLEVTNSSAIQRCSKWYEPNFWVN